MGSVESSTESKKMFFVTLSFQGQWKVLKSESNNDKTQVFMMKYISILKHGYTFIQKLR